MEDLLLFIMATVGLTWTITKGSIFKRFREFISKKKIKYPKSISIYFVDELLGCHKCLGLWSGLAIYMLQYYQVDIVVYGFSGVMICWTIFDVNSLINRK